MSNYAMVGNGNNRVVAQLGEHLTVTQKVAGSKPVNPAIIMKSRSSYRCKNRITTMSSMGAENRGFVQRSKSRTRRIGRTASLCSEYTNTNKLFNTRLLLLTLPRILCVRYMVL